MDTVLIVNKFPDVFIEDLSGVPLTWAIDFRIEFEPRTGPISKASYCMALAKLNELKVTVKKSTG